MSQLIFNGQKKTMTLVDHQGKEVGSWPATTHPSTKSPMIPAGVHAMQDAAALHRPTAPPHRPAGKVLYPDDSNLIPGRSAIVPGMLRVAPFVANKGQHSGLGITATGQSGAVQISGAGMAHIAAHIGKDPVTTMQVHGVLAHPSPGLARVVAYDLAHGIKILTSNQASAVFSRH